MSPSEKGRRLADRKPLSSVPHTGAPSRRYASVALGSSSSGDRLRGDVHAGRLVRRVQLQPSIQVPRGNAL